MKFSDAWRIAGMLPALGLHSCRKSDRLLALRPPEQWNGRLVVLVHGLTHRGVVLKNLGNFLRTRGYRVWLYDYSTYNRKSLMGHSSNLRNRLEELVRRQPAEAPLDLVTHSMGGLLFRAAWAEASPELHARFGRIVMLAPPNRGSRAASRALRLLPVLRHISPPLADLRREPDSTANQLPWPEKIEIGIISGSRDWEVRPDEWPMPGMTDHWAAIGGHAFLMQRHAVWMQVADFLKTGRFRKEKNSGTDDENDGEVTAE